jgi:CRISPR-associated protein Csd1
MILQRLVEYYERKRRASEDPIPAFGLSRERISFELVIDPDGERPELNDLRVEHRGKAGKPQMQARWMIVPYRGDRSSSVEANFLWDNTGYVFGRTKKTAIEDKKRSDFLKLHETLLEMAPTDEGLRAVVRFLSSWDPGKYESFPLAQEAVEQNVVFRIRGRRVFVHESGGNQRAWTDFFRGDIEQRPGKDLITGDRQSIAAIHFLIQGVRGAQTTGASLSSFNDTAYTSYGLKSSYNSPVSIDNIFKYGSALKELLVFDDRRLMLGDATVTFWAERPTALEEFVSDLLGDAPPPPEDAPPEDKERVRQARLFLSQLREGHAGTDAVDEEDRTRFYVLGLSPNAARISVRFWLDSTVGEMKVRLAQHMSDVQLIGARENDPPLMIRRIVLATGRAETDSKGRLKSYDAGTVPPLLAGAVAGAVLTGSPYPATLLVAMLNRLRADGVISHPRIAAIKACIVRNSRLQGKPKEVSVALDFNRTDSPYVAGRLFALLEKIQSDSSGGELNSTIKDRYFSAASATPGIIFPRLIRLGQHHLAKMETGQKIYYERQIGEVMGKLDGFPRNMNLESQGLFAVGYYHQRQHLFTKREKEGATE